eukprot:gnl/TRDRNA2_/TRDRNA2_80055_c0_seq1.p1 gnl/TRDRNA2_/TRDRNA2_80055_c0~~gnl/TRDRNA2_/TRDRNA2_80055_c0_seq1.p1  ORF type:complete len:258 (-),score=17.36 gnl/TRDRNA2_/TRDRNA2_80055_c0_seq1:95-868(-)
MACAECQADLAPGAQFCALCGTVRSPSLRFCNNCISILQPEVNVCSKCGTRQKATRAASECGTRTLSDQPVDRTGASIDVTLTCGNDDVSQKATNKVFTKLQFAGWCMVSDTVARPPHFQFLWLRFLNIDSHPPDALLTTPQVLLGMCALFALILLVQGNSPLPDGQLHSLCLAWWHTGWGMFMLLHPIIDYDARVRQEDLLMSFQGEIWDVLQRADTGSNIPLRLAMMLVFHIIEVALGFCWIATLRRNSANLAAD